MLYEYAVEPQAIGKSWETLRYLLEKFGFDKGRLISEFPKGWFREVYRAADTATAIQKARMTELLNLAKTKHLVLRFRRPYNPDLGGWLENALAEHARVPFHAIIAADARAGAEYVLDVDEIDEQHPLWTVPFERAIPRDVNSLATALEGFLHFGSRVVFVDPFFDPFAPGQKRIFSRCLGMIRTANERALCEIHYRYHEDGVSPEDLERHAGTLFRDIIPEGLAVTIFCWKERDGGEDFHARYLLTDKGGVRVDAGFDPVGNHQSTDVSLMDLTLAQLRLQSFTRGSQTYELVEPVIEVRRDGTVNRV